MSDGIAKAYFESDLTVLKDILHNMKYLHNMSRHVDIVNEILKLIPKHLI